MNEYVTLKFSAKLQNIKEKSTKNVPKLC